MSGVDGDGGDEGGGSPKLKKFSHEVCNRPLSVWLEITRSESSHVFVSSGYVSTSEAAASEVIGWLPSQEEELRTAN